MLKSVEITVEEGRDKGKKFKITEMPAVKMDKWATKALLILASQAMPLTLHK